MHETPSQVKMYCIVQTVLVEKKLYQRIIAVISETAIKNLRITNQDNLGSYILKAQST